MKIPKTPFIVRFITFNPKPRHVTTTATTFSPASTLVSDVVSLLTHHPSPSKWTHLHSLLNPQLSPLHFSQIVLQLKSNPRLALSFFHFTLRHSLCAHSLLSFCSIIHALSRARLKSHAISVFKIALLHNSPIKLFEMLVKTYRECDSAPFVFDLLIKTCFLMRKIDDGLEIVSLLRLKGISPQIGTCNMLINEVCKFKGCFQGFELFKELFGFVGSVKIRPSLCTFDEILMDLEKDSNLNVMSGKIRPNVHSFNALLIGFSKYGEFQMVEEVWSEMRRVGCVGDSLSHSVLIEVFFERGKVCEGAKVWEEMRMKRIEADAVAYNAMIGGFCKIGEVEKAEILFREMGLKGLESSGVTFEHLIKGYCGAGDIDSAILVYKDMCRKGFRVGALTFDALVGALCEKKRVFEALKMMKVVKKDVEFCPSRKSYELLIRGLCEHGKMEEALKVQAEMVGKGFKPDSETYGIFIDGYAKLGNEDMAAMLKKEMVDMQKQKQED